MGCVMQVGDQAVNVGRNAALAAGFPEIDGRHDGRPPVRLVPAGRALRGPGRDRRRVRRRDRRRRREHDPGADGRVVHSRQPCRSARRCSRATRTSCPRASRPSSSPRSGTSPARTTTASRSSRTARAARATDEGRFEREIVPIEVTGEDGTELMTHRRGHPARLVDGDARQAEAGVQARRRGHRGELVADHRRLRRRARS